MTFEEEQALIASLIGHTIAAAEWCNDSPDMAWDEKEYALITLDDGRTIRFGGWGYDAWGATIELLDNKPGGRV